MEKSALVTHRAPRATKTIIVFAACIAAFWIARLCESALWIHYMDTASNALQFVSLALGILLIPAFAILSIVTIHKRHIETGGETLRHRCAISLVAVSLCIHLAAWGLAADAMETSYESNGYSPIIGKAESGEAYTFTIRDDDADVVFNCDHRLYDELVADENLAYAISYRCSALSPGQGYLKYIRTDDVIDNRH